MSQARDILEDARSLLDTLSLDLPHLVRILSPEERDLLVGALQNILASLPQSKLRDEDLLHVVDALLTAIETSPALRKEYLGEIDPQQEIHLRSVSIREFEARQESVLVNGYEERVSIANTMRTQLQAIIDALLLSDGPTSHPPADQPPSGHDDEPHPQEPFS